MFAMIAAALRGLKNALLWVAGCCGDLLMLPFRWLAPSPGRSAIPPAPPARPQAMARNEPLHTPDASPAAHAQRQAAMTLMWLARRLRQGSGAGELSTGVSNKIKRWALSLTDEQAKQAIGAGFMRVSQHVSGVNPIEGLPPAADGVAKAGADNANDRAEASNMIRTRKRRVDYAPAAISSMI